MSDINQTVLVIENEAHLQATLGRLLRKKFGVNALFVASGEEAVKVLEERSDWKLIISDWNLDTGMDGGQVLLWVLNQKPDLLNHYVFFSSSVSAEEMACSTGIPFMRKPVGTDEICDTLRPFLQGNN